MTWDGGFSAGAVTGTREMSPMRADVPALQDGRCGFLPKVDWGSTGRRFGYRRIRILAGGRVGPPNSFGLEETDSFQRKRVLLRQEPQ